MRHVGFNHLIWLCGGLVVGLCALPLQAQQIQKKKNTIDRKSDQTPNLLGSGLGQNLQNPGTPTSIRFSIGSNVQYDSATETFAAKGGVTLHSDNDLTLKANRANINLPSETATLDGKVSISQKRSIDQYGRPSPGIRLSANHAKLKAKDGTVSLAGFVSVIQEASMGTRGKIIPGMQLFAKKVFLNAKSKTIVMDGDVSIYQGPTLHRGNHAVYNYGTGQLETEGLTSGLGPILLESDGFRMINHKGKKAFIGENAGITTHDVEKPNYWLRSKKTTIYPGDRVIFNNLKLYAGNTPVFWLPYLSQPLDANLGYHLLPGARGNWGAYLLNTYGIMLGGNVDEVTGARDDAWLLSKWHLDILSRRGIGTGLDLFDTRLDHNKNLGWLKLYYISDRNPTIERTAEPRGIVDSNRWKLELKHRLDLFERDQHKTRLDFDITALSDRYFLEDFEPHTYRINPNPDNTVGIYHTHPEFLAGAYARVRINDFYQTDRRSPELFFDQIKNPIANSNILHEGQTTFGIYDERLANFRYRELENLAASLPATDPRQAEIDNLLADRGYTRFHTYHEFSMPLNTEGKIAITPRVGAGYSRYWSLDNDAHSFDRTHISAGVDASIKFSKAYPNLVNKKWGVDGMLHIFQPYANFSQLSTNEPDPSFHEIEVFTPSTRPRPLEVGRFTATDSLADWSIIRLGARNRLLTKRGNGTHEWLALNTYMDFFMNDPEFGRNISNLYNDLSWQPLPWMQLNLETQFPIAEGGSGFREFAGNITLMPNASTELRFGFRQLNNHPVLLDSTRGDLRAYTRISDTWGLGLYHQWEFDDSTLEVQQYSIHRDFDSWTASLGFLLRDNREDKNEYGIMLNFTLKEFPSVSLPFSVDAE